MVDALIALWGDCSLLINWFQTTAKVTGDFLASASATGSHFSLYPSFLGVGMFKTNSATWLHFRS